MTDESNEKLINALNDKNLKILPEELYYNYIGFEIQKFIDSSYLFFLDKFPYSIFSNYKYLYFFSFFVFSLYVDVDYIYQLDSYLMVLSKGGLNKQALDLMSYSDKKKYLDYLVEIFRSMNDPDYKKQKDTEIKVVESQSEDDGSIMPFQGGF